MRVAWLWIVGLLALVAKPARSMPIGGKSSDGPTGQGARAGLLPMGKGVTLPGPSGVDPETFAETLASMAVDWVALPGEHYSKQAHVPESWYDERLPLYSAAVRARGIDPVIFGWVTPQRWQAEADRLIKSARLVGATTIRINPENDWRYGVSGLSASEIDQRARALVRRLQGEGYAVEVTSYGGGPKFFGASFPWRAFGETADAGSPQLYSQRGPEARAARVRTWREDAGFQLVRPTIGFADEPDNIVQEAKDTPHDGALAGWSWNLLKSSPSRRAAWGSVTVDAGGAQVG